MYTSYLFLIALAVLVAGAVSDDSISMKSDGKLTSMSTDQLCRSAGFVKDTRSSSESSASAQGSSKMTTADIILTVLGVTAGVIILAFVGNYFYKKQKVN